MNRRLPHKRGLIADQNERREPPTGLCFMDVFGAMRAAYETVLDIGTDHVLRIVIEHFDSIRFGVEERELATLRSTVRAVVSERLLDMLREQVKTSGTEPTTGAPLGDQTTVHDCLVQLLANQE